jgi:hypothetical protein
MTKSTDAYEPQMNSIMIRSDSEPLICELPVCTINREIFTALIELVNLSVFEFKLIICYKNLMNNVFELKFSFTFNRAFNILIILVPYIEFINYKS